MRFRVSLLAFIVVAGAFALPLSVHAAIPFFGPIIPAAYNVCPGSWGLLITVINNIIEFSITIAIVFVAPIRIAYSGFLMVWNQGNSGQISKAKDMLTNVVIGIVVALAAWMIVDAVMAAFYNAGASVPGGTLQTWSSIIRGDLTDTCLKQKGALPTDSLDQSLTGISATGGTVTPSGKSLSLCSSSNTACGPAVLQSIGFSATQANVMSCIAVTESSGNPNTPNSPTGACGTFQITQGNWKTASLHKAPCSAATSCNDPVCNMQTAFIMFQKSKYQPWTCTGCNAKAQQCISQYGP